MGTSCVIFKNETHCPRIARLQWVSPGFSRYLRVFFAVRGTETGTDGVGEPWLVAARVPISSALIRREPSNRLGFGQSSAEPVRRRFYKGGSEREKLTP